MREERLEFLVEEKSMAVFLREFLPSILPNGFIINENCIVRPHNGKQDLQKNIPRIVRAYKNYPSPVRFMVLHDQDSHDCKALKNKLKDLINRNTSINPTSRSLPENRKLEISGHYFAFQV